MGDPVLHLVVGPNGSGKSTFFAEILGPATGLDFINPDEIVASRWPGADTADAYEAAELAATMRERATVRQRKSFATEATLSDPSKVELITAARGAGYRVTLHLVMVPEDLAVERSRIRAVNGDHAMSEEKISDSVEQVWNQVADAIGLADETFVYDNSRASRPFRPLAAYASGRVIGDPSWPTWTGGVRSLV